MVYALYSLVLFIKLKPDAGNFFLNSCLYNKSGNPDSPVHSSVTSYFKFKIHMKSVALVIAKKCLKIAT